MRLTVILTIFLLAGIASSAQQPAIIPRPLAVKQGTGHFVLSPSTSLVVLNGVDDNSADFLNEYLQSYYGFGLKKVKAATANSIRLTTLQMFVPGTEGAYRLSVEPKGISIEGETASGTFYGMQTLIQLLPAPAKGTGVRIPVVNVQDEPRFGYRGMHLDVCRHYFPVSFIKKYIDYLALHKLNTFHWHLTDDQGWRIPIEKYPKLTETGAWRNGTIIGRYPGKGNDNNPYGGYYTKEQIREVVEYASKRFINVIPEIEMPGHGSAAIAAYPWLSCFPQKPTEIPANMISKKSVEEQKNGRIKLVQETWGIFDDVFCAGNDSTFMFLQDVIDEVIELFPSKYFHVGGDECPKTHWKICPKCQQRMKENNLKDEHELQSYFVQRMEKYLNAKGKTLIGWDEILEGGLAPNAIVMSWRGEKGGIDAARQKHHVIMSPGNPVYFDHTQSENEDSVTIGGYNPIEKVYAYDPVPKVLKADEAKYILGGQANLWTEYIKHPSKAEYMLFPRMAALSEILWTKKTLRNWKDFERRLPMQFKRYDLWNANYSSAYYAIKTSVVPAKNHTGVLWQLQTKYPGASIIYSRSAIPTISQPYKAPIRVTENSTYSAGLKSAGPVSSSVSQAFQFNKATGKKITLVTPASAKYPGNGPFTLVDGVQNKMGLLRSREFLGFEGGDCEAIIDLGKKEKISSVKAHVLDQKPSWIHPPAAMKVYYSDDGKLYKEIENADSPAAADGETIESLDWSFPPLEARFVKVHIDNFGVIPAGQPGAGNRAWLFVDEIEVN